eukprot:gene7059-7122_t
MSQAAVQTAFTALHAHKAKIEGQSLTAMFAADPKRFDKLHLRFDDFLFDYSKHRITGETIDLLVNLAEAAGVEAKRDAMFAGEKINITEGRAVLHTALRNLSGDAVMVDGVDVMPDVLAERAKCAAFAAKIRNGAIKGFTGKKLVHIVNIGIGGSDLGPAMVCKALSPYIANGLHMHFVANVDGSDIADTLKDLDPTRTFFIVASKTFTTQETLTNARSARAWIVKALGEEAVGHHFAAVSTKLDLVAAFGIPSDRVFGFWDWVGGRYSVWSSIGLPVMIAIGPKKYEEFLRGAEEVDTHFRSTPLSENIPALMGLLGVWYRNCWNMTSQAVIPYDQRLSRFSAYLQQLDMESNGKAVQLDGSNVTQTTSPVIWGEPGTNGQHAFFQCLHQGTDIVPVDFFLAANPTDADAHHHDLLSVNCFAQSEALMRGRSLDEVKALMKAQGMSAAEIEKLTPHKVFSGSRPSSTFLYSHLTPKMLGRLIALYEHKVFVQGVIWNINSFDQWGVELGKELANRLVSIVTDGADTSALDGSTAGLIHAMRDLRG